MNLRRLTATIALVALVVGMMATPVLADKDKNESNGKGKGSNISEKFMDMDDFEWGLQEVLDMTVRGIFKGRDSGLFAPGAKISHQEAAVSAVRLIDRESAAEALSTGEVATLLINMPDQNDIASWARSSVAMLVQEGVINGSEKFEPNVDATRLYVAVMLAKALKYEAEAQAKMDKPLPFKDAQSIPANLRGYVAVVVDHAIITGYDDKTFKPDQSVKRVEMAVMMGRAYRQVDRDHFDEIEGVIKSVNVAGNSFVIRSENRGDVTLTLADDAAIFIDKVQKTLADLQAGIKAEVKLNAAGEALLVKAERESTPQQNVVNGTITYLTVATSTSLALVTIDSTVYPLSPRAQFKLNGATAGWADLRLGDTVKATLYFGVITKLEIQRATNTVTGQIIALTPVNGSTPAKIFLTPTAPNSTTAIVEYTLAANAVIKLNSQTAQFADLRVNDEARLTIQSGLVQKVEVTRSGDLIVTGIATTLTPATSTSVAQVTVNGTAYPVSPAAVVKLNNATSTFANLHVGDTVRLSITAGLVNRIEATRTTTTVSGKVVSVTVATATAPAKILLNTSTTTTPNYLEYTLASNAVIKIDGQTALLTALVANDSATLTLDNSLATKVEVSREVVVSGTIGSLTAAGSGSLAMITVNGVAYPVAPTPVVKLNNISSTFNALAVGDTAQLTIVAGLVIKIEATRTTATVNGKITNIVPVSGASLARVSINTSTTSTPAISEYQIAAEAVIKLDGAAALLANLQINDSAALTVTNGVVTKLEATRELHFTGVISAMSAATSSSLAIIAVGNNPYPVAATAVVKLNSDASTFASLRIGDTATLTVVAGVVTRIEAIRTITTVSGKISGIVPAGTGTTAKVQLNTSNTTTPAITEYAVASDLVVKVNTVTAQLADVVVGDAVTLTLTNGSVTKIEVTRPETIVEGSIISLIAASGNTPAQVQIGSTAGGSFIMTTYSVTAATQIKVNGATAAFANLLAGDRVRATLQGSLLTKLEVTR